MKTKLKKSALIVIFIGLILGIAQARARYDYGVLPGTGLSDPDANSVPRWNIVNGEWEWIEPNDIDAAEVAYGSAWNGDPNAASKNNIYDWGHSFDTDDDGDVDVIDATVWATKQAADADLTTLAASTAWRIFYSDGSSVITQLALGADGTFLESNGASAAPAFRTLIAADIPDISATYQPLDANLTAIADLNTTAYGRGFLDDADANETRPNLELGSINVQDYPYLAKGDGVTDDTDAIQDAIAAAVAAGGGEIYFPTGTYLSEKITISDDYIVLSGNGPYLSIIKSLSDANSIEITGEFCRMDRLGIDGNGTATKFHVNAGNYLEVNSCRFLNHTTYQIHTDAIDVQFRCCIAGASGQGSSTAVVLAEYNKVLFDGCKFNGGEICPSIVLEIVDSDRVNGVTISNCLLESGSGKTIWIKDNIDGLKIENCWMETSAANTTHIYFASGISVRACKIVGNFIGSSQYSVYLDQINSAGSRIDCTDNMVSRQAFVVPASDPNYFSEFPCFTFKNHSNGSKSKVYLGSTDYFCSEIESQMYYSQYNTKISTHFRGLAKQTTDGNEVSLLEIYMGNGSANVPSAVAMNINISGRDATGQGSDVNFYKGDAVCRNTGTAALIAETYVKSETDADFDCKFDVTGDYARVRITGEAAKTIDWNGDISINRLE